MKNNNIFQIAFSAISIALGILLPMAFHFIQNAGSIILPMHLPVLLAGFIVNPFFALLVGLITPFLSSILTAMPPAPVLPGMMVELATYGFVTSLLVKYIKINNGLLKNYLVLIIAMLSGRIVSGLMKALIFNTGKYTLTAWITGSFITALPGIIIQIIILPLLVNIINSKLKYRIINK